MAKNHSSVPLDRLEKAVSRLPPIEREILVLSARELLSSIEIANRLDITPVAAERLLARALRRLDRAIELEQRPWWRLW